MQNYFTYLPHVTSGMELMHGNGVAGTKLAGPRPQSSPNATWTPIIAHNTLKV